MALRPARKTLSSLAGILVMAAVLWLLLNFVYAPSCGRFACSLEPAWWPQAEADSGDTCPDSITAAADMAEQALRDAGVEFPPAGRHPAASHVETKIAAAMRENGVTYGVLVINHPGGPCGADPRPSGGSVAVSRCRPSCRQALPSPCGFRVPWSR